MSYKDGWGIKEDLGALIKEIELVTVKEPRGDPLHLFLNAIFVGYITKLRGISDRIDGNRMKFTGDLE